MPAEATRFWYVPDAGGPRPRAVSHLGAPITKQPDSQDHSARPELTPVAGASASTRKQQNQMDLTRETPANLVAAGEQQGATTNTVCGRGGCAKLVFKK